MSLKVETRNEKEYFHQVGSMKSSFKVIFFNWNIFYAQLFLSFQFNYLFKNWTKPSAPGDHKSDL